MGCATPSGLAGFWRRYPGLDHEGVQPWAGMCKPFRLVGSGKNWVRHVCAKEFQRIVDTLSDP